MPPRKLPVKIDNPVQMRADAVRRVERVHENLRQIGLDDLLSGVIGCAEAIEDQLGALSLSRHGCSSDSELHHAVVVGRKELQAALMQVQHAMDTFKMLAR